MWVRTRLMLLSLGSLSLFLLSACGGNISVTADASVPPPLVDAHPFSVGVYYPSELTEYIHEQEMPNKVSIDIDIGKNQERIFGTIFGQIFQELVKVESLDSLPQHVAGVVVPAITDVQLMTPQQSRNDYYEIWIRYRFEIILPDDTKLDFDAGRDGHQPWTIAAYGKANKQDYSRFMEKADSAIAEATNNAFRDTATMVVLGLSNPPRPPNQTVRAWIEENSTP